MYTFCICCGRRKKRYQAASGIIAVVSIATSSNSVSACVYAKLSWACLQLFLIVIFMMGKHHYNNELNIMMHGINVDDTKYIYEDN